MRTTLFITIDTEEDLWDQWSRKDNPVENIKHLSMLQEIFNRYGAIPTYLVNYPVVSNEESCRIVKRLHDNYGCEIGTHIHPWNTPPFVEDVNPRNSMICNLPQKLIYEKIKMLHGLIKNRLGLEPTCFRAGRWGFGSTVASVISDFGYHTDSSVTPFCDWKYDNGPDFTDASTFPYRFNPIDVVAPNPNGHLLEIPPTIGFLHWKFSHCLAVRKWLLRSRLSRHRLIGVLERLKLINFRWLSPELTSASDMILLAKNFIRRGHRFLNMCLHSTSLLPGKSPFVKDRHDLAILLDRIDVFLRFAYGLNMFYAPLTAISLPTGMNPMNRTKQTAIPKSKCPIATER